LEKLIKELEELRTQPNLSNNQVVGAVIAAATRFRSALDDRVLGMQALSAALAMQPEIDAHKLHDDFYGILNSHFDSGHGIPVELKDIAAAIKLARGGRQRGTQ
jgi:hypothetical protein